jgi:hypothetical protein
MSRTYNFRRNITLYHGTLKALLPGIMEKGLRPRGLPDDGSCAPGYAEPNDQSGDRVQIKAEA